MLLDGGYSCKTVHGPPLAFQASLQASKNSKLPVQFIICTGLKWFVINVNFSLICVNTHVYKYIIL